MAEVITAENKTRVMQKTPKIPDGGTRFKFWITVYGPGWDQNIGVDRVEVSDASLSGFVGDDMVCFIHLQSVDAFFVTPARKKES